MIQRLTMYPQWVKDFMNKQFSSGGYMGEDGWQWVRAARSWFRKYLKAIGATDFEFRVNHYEFYAFFKLENQGWYISSGDCRFKCSDWMLLRTARDNKDYTGGHNQCVPYDERFFYELNNILGVQHISLPLTK